MDYTIAAISWGILVSIIIPASGYWISTKSDEIKRLEILLNKNKRRLHQTQ
jgi:hypothetical protein